MLESVGLPEQPAPLAAAHLSQSLHPLVGDVPA